MYCRNCARELSDKAVACPSCGLSPHAERKFCPNCGSPTEAVQAICLKCGVALAPAAALGGKEKVTAGLLGIFLGGLGIHKFYLGYKTEGIVMLCICLLGGLVTCGWAAGVIAMIGLIEGVIYLTRTDADFQALYVNGKKGWF